MQGTKPPRGPSIESLADVLERKLEDEEAVLATLIAEAASGRAHTALWTLLHEAAQRDDRTAELAMAYEQACQPKALKALSPPMTAEVLTQAASFFSEVMFDGDGALAYLERALSAHPDHEDAFARMELALVERGDGVRLCELYTQTAAHCTERDEQLRLLRRAAELVDVFEDEAHRAFPIYERILKLDPGDSEARRALELWYRRAGKLSELARMIEATIGQDGINASEARGKLLGIYLSDLKLPDRALAQVEELLGEDPRHGAAREAARPLLEHKMLGERAATALEAALTASGETSEALKILEKLVELRRGQPKLDALKRLAKGRAALDPSEASFSLIERALTGDVLDEELRPLLLRLAEALGRQGDAGRLLLKLGGAVKEPAPRAKIHLEAGQALLDAGEQGAARAALSVVIEAAPEDAALALPAASALEHLISEGDEPKVLAGVLSLLVALESEPANRLRVQRKLAYLAEHSLRDLSLAIDTLSALREGEEGERRVLVEDTLERLLAETGRHGELVSLLLMRAEAVPGTHAARSYLLRVAELRATKLSDAVGALAVLRQVDEIFGASRELFSLMGGLLEQLGRWAELASLLEEEAAFIDDAEQIPVLARLATLRLTRLGDAAGAIGVALDALALDPTETSSKALCASLLTEGPHRLLAAELLEGYFRSRDDGEGLLRVLSARAELDERLAARLDALAEATSLAAELRGPVSPASLAFEGLALAVSSDDAERIATFAALVEAFAPETRSPSEHANGLIFAVGEGDVRSPEAAELIERAAELLIEAGELERALAAYKRSLAFSPTPTARRGVDDVLTRLERHEERRSHLRWSLTLELPQTERRESLRTLAILEQRLGGDVAAVLRAALENEPEDREVHEQLVATLEARDDKQGLREELGRALRWTEGGSRAALLMRMAGLAQQVSDAAGAKTLWRQVLALPEGSTDAVLSSAEQAASELGDKTLLLEIVRRRAALASEPEEASRWRAREGEILSSEPSTREEAASAWKQAASLLASLIAKREEAASLYERALSVSPSDSEALDSLASLYRELGAWPKLLDVLERALMVAPAGAASVTALLAMEEPARLAGAVEAFAKVVERALDAGRISAPDRREVLTARARALSTEDALADQASEALRALIEAFPDDERGDKMFEAFLATTPREGRRLLDLRWLLAQRAERGGEPAALVAWAEAEETLLGDKQAAVQLYRRALASDAGCERALERLPRLLLSLGDAEGARVALLARRTRLEGQARKALDLELASLLDVALDRPEDALSALSPVLDAEPDEHDALAIVARVLRRSGDSDEVQRARSRAVGLIERAFEASGDAELLRLLLTATAGVDELASARLGWTSWLLDVLTTRGEAAEALSLALSAAKESPLELSFWDTAESLARQLDRPADVAEAMRVVMAEPAVAPVLGQRVVEFHEEWFDDEDTVVALLEQVLEVDGSAYWAFERLKVTYGASERWADLLTLYDRGIAHVTGDEERLLFLEDAAQIARDFAADEERAIGYFEQMLRLRPADARLVSSLERLYERCGRHRALIALLSAQLPGLDLASAQQQRMRLAALWLDGLGDAPQAFVVIEELLSVDPESEEAIGLLERVLALPLPPSASGAALREEAEVRRRAARLLAARFTQLGQFEALARIHELELTQPVTRDEQVRLLRALCELRIDKLGDLPGAFDATAKLLSLEHRSQALLLQLDELAAKLDLRERQVEALAGVASETRGEPGSAQLWLAGARVARDALGKSERAAEMLARALAEALAQIETSAAPKKGKKGKTTLASASEAEREIARESARELAALLLSLDRKLERYEVLRTLSALASSATERREVLTEMARVAWDDLSDAPRAIEAFEARLVDAPEDVEALSGLILALEREGRWAALVTALERRASSTSAPAQRRADLLRVAQLHGEALGRPEQALSALRLVRDAFGADGEVVEAEAVLFARSGRYDELVTLLEEQAGAATDAQARASFLLRLAETHRLHTHAYDRAVAAYVASLLIAPQSASAREGLLAIAAAPGHGAGAVEALLALHARLDDWRAAAELVELRLQHASEVTAQVSVLLETATLWEQRGEAPQRAFDCVLRVLMLTPGSLSAADALLRLAELTRQWPVAVDALLSAAGKDVGAAASRALYWRVAEVLRERDPEGAERALEHALSHAPADIELLSALVTLRRRHPDASLIEALCKLSDAIGPDARLLKEAAVAALDVLGDALLAESLSLRAIDAAETHASHLDAERFAAEGIAEAVSWALGIVQKGAEQRGDFALQAQSLLRAAALPFDADRARSMRRRAAEIYERSLDDLEAAASVYRQLVSLDEGDALSLDHLAQLYRRQGKTAALIDVRQRQVSLVDSAEARVALQLDLAALLQSVGDQAGAVEVLQAVLAASPVHAEAVISLEALLSALGRDGELLSLLEEQASRQQSAGAERAADDWARAAEVAEHKLGDVARALVAHRKASDLGRVASLEALARLLMERGEAIEAVPVLERLASLAPAEQRASSGLRLVDAYLACGDREGARQRLEQLTEQVPEDELIRARLAEVYREEQDWPKLASMMAADAVRVSDPRARSARLREAAELLLARGGDPAQAAAVLEEAEQLTPDDAGVVLALSEALRLADKLEDAEARLKRLLDSYGTRRPKERAVVQFQMGMLLGAKGNVRGALAELEAASRIDPTHPRLLHALGATAFEAGELDRAQRALRALLLLLPRAGARAETPRPPVASTSMTPRAPGAGVAASQPQAPGVTRAEVLFLLSRLAERQGDPAKAEELLESAFAHAAESELEQATLERALRSSKRFALLARALEQRVTAPMSAARMAHTLAELAQLYLRHLDKPEDATRAQLRAFKLAPDDARVSEATRALVRETGAVAAYAAELERLALEPQRSEQGPLRQAELLIRLGELAESDLGDVPRAIDAFRRSLSITTALPSARALEARSFTALEALLTRAGDAAGLVSLLEHRLMLARERGASVDALSAPLFRLIELRLLPYGNTLGAEGVFDVDEGVALIEQAIALSLDAERCDALLTQAIEFHTDAEPLLRLAEQRARQAGDLRRLIDVLVRLADVPGEGTRPLREAAELAETLDEPQLAEGIFRQILDFEADPASRDDVVWALLTLAKSSEPGMAVSLKERAAELCDGPEQRALLLDVARLCEGALHEPSRAARIYAQLLEQDPSDRELVSHLAALYRKTGEDALLAEILHELIAEAPSFEERAGYVIELAGLLIREGSSVALERATRLLEDILTEQPEHPDAAALLSELLERIGDLAGLCRHLGRLLDVAIERNDAPVAESLAVRLGGLFEQRERPDDALDIYRSALSVAPRSAPLLRAIAVIIEGRNDAVDAVDALEQLLSVVEGPEAESVAFRLAALHDAAWNPEGAERALEAAFQVHPSAVLRQNLVARYTEAATWTKLAALYVREAEAAQSASEKASALRRGAEVLRGKVGDLIAAAALLDRAHAAQPLDRSLLLQLLEVLSQLGTREANHRAVEVLDVAIGRSSRDVALLTERALRHEALSQLDLALADRERAFALGGARHAQALIETLGRVISATSAPEQSRALRLRAASVLIAQGATAAARQHLDAVLRVDEADPAALRSLASLDMTEGRFEQAAALLERLEPSTEDDAIVALALELSDAGQRAGDPLGARVALERAHRVEPENEQIRALLFTLYEGAGERRKLATMLVEQARRGDGEPRAAMLLRAGRLLLDGHDADPRLATQLFEEARALRPDDLEIQLLLIDALVAQNRGREALAWLTQTIASHRGRRSRQLGALYHRKAYVELRSGDRTDALISLTRAFDSDGSNGPLAIELGQLALEMRDESLATRAFRAITLMKLVSDESDEGATSQAKAQAYLQLALLAVPSDKRKARLLAEKAVAEDPALDQARALRDELKGGLRTGPALPHEKSEAGLSRALGADHELTTGGGGGVESLAVSCETHVASCASVDVPRASLARRTTSCGV